MKSKKYHSILRQPISEENITRISELIVLDQYAWIQTRDDRFYCELDEKIEYNTVPNVVYDTEVAYNNVENLIKSMNLSTNEEQTLRLLYNKLNSHQIAEKLDICFQTVYLCRKLIQNKYLELKN